MHDDDVTPEVASFFAPLSATVGNFASLRNLLLEKYEKDAPIWSLIFRHPKGGAAKIDLERVAEGSGLRIRLYWWIDDYDAGQRRYKWSEAGVLANPLAELPSLLDASLREILGWNHKDLAPSGSGDLGQYWRQFWSKPQFARLNDKYPSPRL